MKIILSLLISLWVTVIPAAVPTSGSQISLNGQTWSAAWSQRQVGEQIQTGISDMGAQLLGIKLLNTDDITKQPVEWFSGSTPLVLASWLKTGYRYLALTELAQTAGWQLKVLGNTLIINTPKTLVRAIQRQTLQPWGTRILVDLDRPTLWRIQPQEKSPLPAAVVTIDATLQPSIPPDLNIESTQSQTVLQLDIPKGLSAEVTTLVNPTRLAIDFKADTMIERSILWAPGMRWQQQYVNIEAERFPVVWLEIDLRTPGLILKPIWSVANTLVGTAPLIQTAQRYGAAAAINGGFFNRNQRLPLGAIRRDGQWVSSPILNRGAIAWDDSGRVKISHLTLQETLTTAQGKLLPILSFNSGYVQAGIARYTRMWGDTYTPLNDDETIVVVENHQVTAQLPGKTAGMTAFSIPINGYLLAIRDNQAAADLPVGTIVSLDTNMPSAYPQIVGAGPLLVQNRQIVLDAKAEKFSDAFIRETAPRSAIATTASGTLLMVTVHNSANGIGPTLAQLAAVLQQMGCIDALNLDGGSSSSLYLGGQLLNRLPQTAARIHNGLGVFLGESRE